jgi:Protein of unknown function (DUF4245)
MLIAAIWLLSRFQHHDPIDPVSPVPYAQILAEARAANPPFPILAPDHVPSGWRATSASWAGTGRQFTWHAGFLTAEGSDAQYVGLDQARQNPAEFREQTTRADEPGRTVTVGGRSWQVWTSVDHDETALVRTDQRGTTTIVSGTATSSVLQTFAGSLATG